MIWYIVIPILAISLVLYVWAWIYLYREEQRQFKELAHALRKTSTNDWGPRKWWQMAYTPLYRAHAMCLGDQVPHFGICKCCDRPSLLWYVHPMTCYCSDQKRDPQSHGPNYVGFCCATCGREYTEYWKERWADYHDRLI